MKSRSLRNTTLLMIMLAMILLLAACARRPAAPSTPAPIATTQSQPAAQPTALPPTVPPAPTSPPPTASPPTAAPPPTYPATVAPTNTAPPPPTATNAPSATLTVAPTQKPSATPTPAPHAIVINETLNVRSGPDTQFEAVARLSSGDALTVVGQSDGCNWLKVLTAQGTLGWVARQSGGVELVKLNLACEEIPALRVPTPTARPLAPTQQPQPTQRSQPTQSPQPSQSGLPADKGCYLFQNFMGAELNVTLGGLGLSDNFKIPASGERLYCFAPGRYNYTIDAPPPWADINGSLDVQAGKHFRFPIQGRP